MSIPGTCSATSTLITSSSRGGGTRSGGVRSQPASSSAPAEVIRYRFCDRSPSPSASTSPSRSRRCSVVYTCPTLSGQTSPVRASNSFCSRRPYFGPSLSRASSAWGTLMSGSPANILSMYTRYSTAAQRRPALARLDAVCTNDGFSGELEALTPWTDPREAVYLEAALERIRDGGRRPIQQGVSLVRADTVPRPDGRGDRRACSQAGVRSVGSSAGGDGGARPVGRSDGRPERSPGAEVHGRGPWCGRPLLPVRRQQWVRRPALRPRPHLHAAGARPGAACRPAE